MSEMREIASGNKVYHNNVKLFDLWKEGGEKEITVIEKAKFLGTEPNNFNPEKPHYLFYQDGKEHVINNSGHLAFKMSQVSEGDMVTAIYAGKTTLGDGQYKGKEAHQWRILTGSSTEASPFD